MVFELLLNLIGSLLLYSELILTLICLLWHIRAAHIVLIYLLWYIRQIRQQTVQSNAVTFAYGSSACGCSDDLSTLLPRLKPRKPYSDVQVISAIFYLFVYDSRLAVQF